MLLLLQRLRLLRRFFEIVKWRELVGAGAGLMVCGLSEVDRRTRLSAVLLSFCSDFLKE